MTGSILAIAVPSLIVYGSIQTFGTYYSVLFMRVIHYTETRCLFSSRRSSCAAAHFPSRVSCYTYDARFLLLLQAWCPLGTPYHAVNSRRYLPYWPTAAQC